MSIGMSCSEITNAEIGMKRARKLAKNAPKFSHEFIRYHTKRYLNNGGKITKLKTPSFEKITNPYKVQSSAIMVDMHLMEEL
jgi:hypothetical protein